MFGHFFKENNQLEAGPGITPPSPKRTSPPSSERRCQVPGCCQALPTDKAYYKRFKICKEHFAAPQVLFGNQYGRFCQQCRRFHALVEFDGTKRSCRTRLGRHNERRRKTTGPGRSSISASSYEAPERFASMLTLPSIPGSGAMGSPSLQDVNDITALFNASFANFPGGYEGSIDVAALRAGIERIGSIDIQHSMPSHPGMTGYYGHDTAVQVLPTPQPTAVPMNMSNFSDSVPIKVDMDSLDLDGIDTLLENIQAEERSRSQYQQQTTEFNNSMATFSQPTNPTTFISNYDASGAQEAQVSAADPLSSIPSANAAIVELMRQSMMLYNVPYSSLPADICQGLQAMLAEAIAPNAYAQ